MKNLALHLEERSKVLGCSVYLPVLLITRMVAHLARIILNAKVIVLFQIPLKLALQLKVYVSQVSMILLVALAQLKAGLSVMHFAKIKPALNNTCQSDSLFRGIFCAGRYASTKRHSINFRCTLRSGCRKTRALLEVANFSCGECSEVLFAIQNRSRIHVGTRFFGRNITRTKSRSFSTASLGIKMNPIDQANNYDKIADHWNGSEFNRENGIEQHRRALQLSKETGKAIDIGCGSSGRIIDLMLEHGFEAEGLDFSIEMLKHAKKRHSEVVFHHADICEWDFSEKYDFISAWNSIWHVPLEYQEIVLRKLCDALTEDGVIIFTSGAVDEPGDGSNPFLGQELYHAALGIPALLNVLSDCGCICRHLENDDWPNLHLYVIAQKNA